jgi:uncharacterized protein (DUF736 family)
MSDYDNTNSGVFFVNDRKEKETHPDYTGKLNVEGKDFYLKGWKKTAKSGTNFLSIAINPVEQKGGGSAPKQPSAPTTDDAPF